MDLIVDVLLEVGSIALMGFIDYIKILKSKGIDRVFPELTKRRDGYSTKI